MVDQSNKPSVYIGLQKKYESNHLFFNICYGLEEEGIPFDSYLSEDNVNQIAQDAAQKSRLGVGIAVGDDNQIVIQHKKMNVDNPFFKKKIDKYFQAKIMGSNAARLVKGIPIKEIPQEDDFYTISESKNNKQNNPVTENEEKNIIKKTETNTANSSAENKEELDSNGQSDAVDEITKLVMQALKNIENSN
ncbi:MAG: glycerol dehydratase reactivase beta/small subunit family protein [Halanaerobium sp.]